MKFVFLIVSILVLCGCIRKTQQDDEPYARSIDTISVEYAKGFEIIYEPEYLTVLTKSIPGNSYFRDSLVIYNVEYRATSLEAKTLSDSIKKVVVQSSTHLAYIHMLKKTEIIQGVCGLSYVVGKDLVAELSHNNVQEICNSDRMEREILLGINPDLVFTYPFGTAGTESYQDIGLNSLMIAEYLETDVLARLEWIKLFGILLNREKEAIIYFDETAEAYNDLVQPEKSNDQFIMNLPWEDNWYMPATNSLVVNLFKDAGLNYYYSSNEGTENILLPKEQVWMDGTKADFWVIIATREGGFSKADLAAEDPAYKEFKAFKNDNILFCNTGVDDYFGKGILEPHIMLKDILYFLEKIENHNPVYFKRLN